LIVLDTSGLLAALDSSQNQHAEAASALREAGWPLLLSPFVLAELDYLLSARVSAKAQRALLDEVARGAYQLEPFTAGDVASATVIIRRYRELAIGLADASIVVLAERHRVLDLLTLDRRHFQALRGPEGQRFRLHPAP
jgi:predicted nucleic acid-binding protein